MNLRLALAALAALAVGACEAPPDAPKKPRPVRYASVGSGSSDDARVFPATVQARDATQVSFRVGGSLAELKVSKGQQVKEGQLIGRIDDSDFKVALAQAQANYQSAKTQRDVAQSAFARVERLYEAGSTALSEYEAAKGQLRSAGAQLSAAGQQVKQARNQSTYATLKSPFDGVINDVPVKQAQMIKAGQPVAIISKGGELEISVGVPENMVSRLKVGLVAEVSITALGDKKFSGAIREVGFSSESSTYPVRIKLTDTPEELRPGMAANAQFALGVKVAALAVPVAAVANAEDGSYVFLLKDSGDHYVATRTKVILGELMKDHFAVKEGVAVGDKVATAGLANLVDGMQVKLLEDKQAQ